MDQAQHDRRIDYIEFASTDVTASRRFYENAFGWSFEDYGPNYTSFRDGRMTGGFRKEASVTPGGPLVVLYAKDLDAVQRAIEKAGGRIVRATFDFPGGKRFHFADPSGNELAVWSE